MIITNIKDIKRYKGISSAMAKAIEYIESGDYKKLPQDKTKYPIYENEVEALRMSYETKVDAKWEAHITWIDIQMILDGEEKMLFAPIYDLKKSGEYLSDKDFQEYEGEKTQEIIARSGDCIIFFPEDGHKPSVQVSGASVVDKVVLKVKA